MKILFLDIDGVLVPYSSPANEFDPQAAKLLKSFLKESGYKIVISSSWRRLGLGEDSILFQQLRKHELLDFIYFPDWRTGLSNAGWDGRITRGARINHYLTFAEPEIDEYIILDDVDDFFTDQQKSRFVQTKDVFTIVELNKMMELAGCSSI
jgi:hypothetical protein